MHQIEKKGWVNTDCLSVFNVVNAVEDYPQFLKGCKHTKVIDCSHSQKTACMTLGKGMLSYELVTTNTLYPPHEMHMDLVEGPFRYLKGLWSFVDENGGCAVTFKLDFEFKNRFLEMAGAPLMIEVADSMVRAFIKRAKSA